MSSSENTFGSRLGNAEKTILHLESLSDYNPMEDELKIVSLRDLYDLVAAHHADTAKVAHDYSIAVRTRQDAFFNDPDCVLKVLSPISSTIFRSFGRKSKEADYIRRIVTKFRRISTGNSKDPDGKKRSTSEASFDSLLKSFVDLVATLNNYGADYKPATPGITLPVLTTKLENIKTYNSNGKVQFGLFKQKRDKRKLLDKQLSKRFQRVKDGLKGQYGPSGTEYTTVSGLVI